MKWSEHALEIPRTVDALQGILTVIPMQAGFFEEIFLFNISSLKLLYLIQLLNNKKVHSDFFFF